MTFRTSIHSKANSKDFLKRGFKSMFSNYDESKKAAPPIDTEVEKKEQPESR